ncbi:septum formation family protein [Frankia sp. AiPa1]|uniref:septum formation family protein n=1 Tax=Frankia sp. AiPa1 TaxID=573492 RepID=UPI00202B6F12|nr:septum formation family protein [Frankia sp. AiPa1]
MLNMRVQLARGFTVAVMASRHQDPFEGLRLNERFVRGARFLEPSAVERCRSGGPLASARCQVVPAPRGLPGFFHRLVSPPRPPGRSRQIARMVTFMAIIVGMITITVVALRQTATRSGPGMGLASRSTTATAASAGGIPTTRSAVTGGRSEPPAGYAVSPALMASLSPGNCLAWTPLPAGGTDVLRPVAPARVSCDRPHIDEVTRVVSVGRPGERFPGASTLAARAQERCEGALRELTGAIDAAPHLTVGAIYPSEPSWGDGVRVAACTARPDDLRARSEPIRIVGSIAI